MQIRRMEEHRKNRRDFLETDGKIDGFCSRCAEVKCKFNITPKSFLPIDITCRWISTETLLGKIRQYNCDQVSLDNQIPNTNKG